MFFSFLFHTDNIATKKKKFKNRGCFLHYSLILSYDTLKTQPCCSKNAAMDSIVVHPAGTMPSSCPR